MTLERTIRQMMMVENVEVDEVFEETTEETLSEDGHTDVASAKRQCKTIAEDAQAILSVLESMDDEGSLPTWWTNKLAVASNSMNKMNDYISNPNDKEDVEEAVEYPHTMYDPETGKSVEAKSPEDHEKYAKMGYTHDKPEDMEEAKRDPSKSGGTGYDLYHKDFSSAMKHAYDYAKKKFGITIDPKEIDDKVASGPRKPSAGKTNSYRLKGDKGSVQIQVANLDNKRYELNMYKESVEMELDEKFKVGDKVKVKKGTLKSPDQRHYETKAGTIVKDYKDGEFKINFGGNDDFSIDGKFLVKESVELDENAGLIKDYQGMKAQGKKDSNILDALMSMPKYKRMSKDQMAKIIGDAKRKGIFKEDVELDEAKSKEQQIADLEKMLGRISGNTASVRMKKFALQRKIDKLKNEELEEAYKTPAEAGAYEAGKKAARAGKKYDDNPNKKGSKEYTAWSKGHNEARAKGMKKESELDELSPATHKRYQDAAFKDAARGRAQFRMGTRSAKSAYDKEQRRYKGIDTSKYLNRKQHGVKEEVELDEAFTTAIKFPNYFKMDQNERNKIIDIYKKYRGKVSSQVGKDGSVTVDGDPTSMRKAEAELKKAGVKFMATESVEIAEAKPPFDVSKADYAGAAKELTQYAKTKGGMDKDDFLSFANRMASIAKKKSPSVMSKFVRDLQGLDTSPREKIVDVMRKNGIKVTMTNRGFQVEEYTDHTVGMSIMEKAIAKIREAEGEKMTDAQMKKREEIVKSMKDKEQEFKDKYGDRWKEVMYATATKMAMGK
jgi:hypothetical protein